ncbi:hypothetical protein QUB75_29940 [Microcoleus sp. K1-B6]|uniref:hypothetical protein n=1 Tax=Microcoleus sp. K1-B6 TaxID=2818787 RepID=UPI002FD7F3BE
MIHRWGDRTFIPSHCYLKKRSLSFLLQMNRRISENRDRKLFIWHDRVNIVPLAI